MNRLLYKLFFYIFLLSRCVWLCLEMVMFAFVPIASYGWLPILTDDYLCSGFHRHVL